MAKKKEEIIEIKPIHVLERIITIEGDTDITLNKMNKPTERDLTESRKGKAKEKKDVNIWECIITSLHWLIPLEQCDIDQNPDNWDAETMHWLLENNKPCISAFGMKKSLGQAVTRNEIDTYATKLEASVNVVGAETTDGLIPIDFVEWHLDEKLMQPQRGAPILARINRFSEWKASFKIRYIEGGKYSLEQLVNIINLAGFGIGIGSGRKSDYGRYHVVDVR